MPLPTAISDLSQTAASNYPAGSDSPNVLDDVDRAHASFIALLRDGKGLTDPVQLASGATTDIGGQNAMFVEITGTTTITSFGTTYNGPRFLRFTGALTLTHNATTVNLPGGVNITTTAGDTCIAIPNQAGNGWNVVQYQRAGEPPAAPAFSAKKTSGQTVTLATATKCQMSSETFDTAGAYDAVTNYRFQPAVAGYYQVNGAVNGNCSTSTGRIVAFIYKNGAALITGSTAPQGSTDIGYAVVSGLVQLNGSTDYIELWGEVGGSGTATMLGADTNAFSAYLVRAT